MDVSCVKCLNVIVCKNCLKFKFFRFLSAHEGKFASLTVSLLAIYRWTVKDELKL